MPRRALHHISHLQRATRDDASAAAEADRLHKTREDSLEVERRRAAAAEEAAERSRRNRHQMELDEAELRRVRALEQFNEAERQRQEMQIEGRLRQLEDQELSAQDPPKLPSKSKKCCRTFKILFGILLSLGLVFVVSSWDRMMIKNLFSFRFSKYFNKFTDICYCVNGM